MHENGDARREQRGHEQGQIDGKGADAPGLLLLRLAQQAGDQRSAADARQPREAERDVEHGQDQGRGRHHVGIVRLADEKCIGHVVDQHDQLADHRRDDHLAQCGRDRQLFEYVLFGKACLALHLFPT